MNTEPVRALVPKVDLLARNTAYHGLLGRPYYARALAALAERPAPPHIRHLDPADAAAFDGFQASAREEDLDAAWVELDHWQVFGAFDGERLVAAGSMYPWSLDPALADMGVLTAASGKVYQYLNFDKMPDFA